MTQRKPHPLGAIGLDVLYVVDVAWSEGWGRAMTAGRLHIALPEHTRASLLRCVHRLRARGLVVYRRGQSIRLTQEGRRWLDADGYPPPPGSSPTGRDRRTLGPVERDRGRTGPTSCWRKGA